MEQVPHLHYPIDLSRAASPPQYRYQPRIHGGYHARTCDTDKPARAQQNAFHGEEIRELLQLAVIPNRNSSKRLATQVLHLPPTLLAYSTLSSSRSAATKLRGLEYRKNQQMLFNQRHDALAEYRLHNELLYW